MGLNVKRKFFGIDNFENYIRISNLKLTITNNLCQQKELYWEIEFKISLNSKARDIEKISTKIINKEIDLGIKTQKEKEILDEILSGYINQEKGYGELGSIIVTIPLGQLIEKQIHPLFFKKSEEEMFTYFYDIFKKEYKGYLGIKIIENIEDNQEKETDFNKKMISEIKMNITQRSI
jgi:hypothetical protein